MAAYGIRLFLVRGIALMSTNSSGSKKASFKYVLPSEFLEDFIGDLKADPLVNDKVAEIVNKHLLGSSVKTAIGDRLADSLEALAKESTGFKS